MLKTGGWLLISDMYARRREILFEQIKEQALAWSVSWVEPEEIDSLSIIPGEDRVTLVTCTPYGINSHRLLIRGERSN